MKQDKKIAAACSDAAKYLRKCADALDKIASGDMREDDSESPTQKRRICD